MFIRFYAVIGFTILWLMKDINCKFNDIRHDDNKPRPFIEDEECPRKPEQISDRKCFKKCHRDEDCKGNNKFCRCDDVCGKSCIKPSRRCESLKAIFNGKYEIVPFNQFGARANYTCNNGYVLHGKSQRICQGDGYWSGAQPTCELEESFPTLSGKCPEPPELPNAVHDGPVGQQSFPLGSQLTYSCSDGFKLDGYFRAMCVGAGRWVGPRMTCSPRSCPHPGDIANGRRIGNIFNYPNQVRYACREGYKLIGRPNRRCEADGHWSGATPSCKPVTCPHLMAPSNGRMQGSQFTYGAILRFYCNTGFELAGSDSRKCGTDGVWSGQNPYCKVIDCGTPGPVYDMHLEFTKTTYGSRVYFRCFSGTTFDGEPGPATCLANGRWSHGAPKCWRKCRVPNIINGTIDQEPVQTMEHNSTINVTCNEGHVLDPPSHIRPVCHNSTWSVHPRCLPASCNNRRPPELSHGFVRFHGVRHLDRAKYKCDSGYVLVGNDSAVCMYGKWSIEVRPACKVVTCPYPGGLENGRLLIVGTMGKYDYNPYAKSMAHNTLIEFQCHKGFKRDGPSAATCIDGFWSPSDKPRCLPVQHRKMSRIFRGRREVGTFETGENRIY